MNKVRAVRRIQFCAGHRVRNHESKCKNIHGHKHLASTASFDMGSIKGNIG